jgi:ribosomal protein L35AE/L33A
MITDEQMQSFIDPDGNLLVALNNAYQAGVEAEREACDVIGHRIVFKQIQGASDEYMVGKEMAVHQYQLAIRARSNK